jgi:hypothetical protein
MINCSEELISILQSGNFETNAKIEILDSNENLLEEITEDIIEGSISVDGDNDIKRNFTLTINNDDNYYTPGSSKLIWIDKKIKLYKGVLLSSGIYEYIPQGVFIFTSPKAISKSTQKQVVLNGNDKMAGWGKRVNTLTIEAGIKIDVAIKIVLDEVESKFNFDDCDEVTPYSLTYQPGKENKAIVKELADCITWDIGYNVHGELRFKPKPNNIDQIASVWTYQEEDYSFYAGSEMELDDTELYNHILTIGASSQNATVSAEAMDTNVDSPTAIQYIGDRLYMHNNGSADSLITTVALAQARSDWELRKRLQLIEKQRMSILSNFLHEPGDIITLIDSYIDTNDKYELLKFTVPLNMDMITSECWKVRSFS